MDSTGIIKTMINKWIAARPANTATKLRKQLGLSESEFKKRRYGYDGRQWRADEIIAISRITGLSDYADALEDELGRIAFRPQTPAANMDAESVRKLSMRLNIWQGRHTEIVLCAIEDDVIDDDERRQIRAINREIIAILNAFEQGAN